MALGQELQNLTISSEAGDVMVVPFNPTEYASERGTTWAEVAIPGLDAPVLQWIRGEGETVTLDLFLDVTDAMVDAAIVGADVRAKYVAQLDRWMRQDTHRHRPPIVSVLWGTQPVIVSAVVQRLSVTYTLFDVAGRPARATAKLTLRQASSAARQLAEVRRNSPDRDNVATVREGDTLASISFREYRDARHWRAIARVNRIADPQSLVPGQVLLLPRVV